MTIDYNDLNFAASFLDPENWRRFSRSRPMIGLIMSGTPEVIIASSLRALVNYINELGFERNLHYNTAGDRIARKGYYGCADYLIVPDNREDSTDSLPDWSVYTETHRPTTVANGKAVYLINPQGEEIVYKSIVEMLANHPEYGTLSRIYHWLSHHPAYITPDLTRLILTQPDKEKRQLLNEYIHSPVFVGKAMCLTTSTVTDTDRFTIKQIIRRCSDVGAADKLNHLLKHDWYFDAMRGLLYFSQEYLSVDRSIDHIPYKYRSVIVDSRR